MSDRRMDSSDAGAAGAKPARDMFPFQPRRDEAPAEPDGGYLKLDIDANHNQRVVFQEIRTRKRVTRSQLAAITGLTKPTVVNVSRQLLQAGLILEAERSTSGRGQPAWVLELNPDGAYSVGLNIDRDHLTLVGLDLSGRPCGRVSAEIGFASPDEAKDFFAMTLGRRSATRFRDPAPTGWSGSASPCRTSLAPSLFAGKPATYTAWATH